MATWLCAMKVNHKPLPANNGWELAQMRLELDALKRRVEALEQERADIHRFDDDGGYASPSSDDVSLIRK